MGPLYFLHCKEAMLLGYIVKYQGVDFQHAPPAFVNTTLKQSSFAKSSLKGHTQLPLASLWPRTVADQSFWLDSCMSWIDLWSREGSQKNYYPIFWNCRYFEKLAFHSILCVPCFRALHLSCFASLASLSCWYIETVASPTAAARLWLLEIGWICQGCC